MSPADAPPGPCVLVVDDDPAMRRFLDIVLRRGGFQVATAASGAEALSALVPGAGAEQPPVVVAALLLDAMLPDMRGFDLARRLFEHPSTSRLPICFLTGAVHGRVPVEAGVACIVKPTSPALLVATLQHLLSGPDEAEPATRRAAVDRVEERSLL